MRPYTNGPKKQITEFCKEIIQLRKILFIEESLDGNMGATKPRYDNITIVDYILQFFFMNEYSRLKNRVCNRALECFYWKSDSY